MTLYVIAKVRWILRGYRNVNEKPKEKTPYRCRLFAYGSIGILPILIRQLPEVLVLREPTISNILYTLFGLRPPLSIKTLSLYVYFV